jgi:ABC-type phosphate/phosphonate transport system substrate-binding protein
MSKSLTLEDKTRIAALPLSIAALPMYDLPELQPATDAFWHAIAERLKEAGLTAPSSLTRNDDYHATWRDPELLLGQACGYPLVTQFKGEVQIVATPIYGAAGCESFEHCSFFIVNADAGHQTLSDLYGSGCAVNGFDSNTGMNLLRAAIAPIARGRPFFRSVIVTGAHRKSLDAVAHGRADIAAIDCVSFAHFQRFEPHITARVSKIGRSLRTAAPPYITSATDPGILRVLREALKDVAITPQLESVRSLLMLEGFAFETDIDYDSLLRVEKSAAALGYPRLC